MSFLYAIVKSGVAVEKKQKKKKTAESGSGPADHPVYSGRTWRDAVCFPQG